MNEKIYAKCFISCFIIITLIAIFRWVLLWNVQYTYMDGEYPFWMQQKDYINSYNNKREIIFLGDSRMKAAIIPAELCDNSYNLAVGGATTVEMYYSLKRYLKKHPKPEKVIMGFGGFHYQWSDCYKTRTHYFHFLSLREEIESQYMRYKIEKHKLIELKTEIIDSLKYNLLFPQKYSAACINSTFTRGELNHLFYDYTSAEKGQMYFGRAEESSELTVEAGVKNFTLDVWVDLYFQRIVALCNDNSIPLYIEQLPMNEASFEAISTSDWYNDFQACLIQMADKSKIPINTVIPCYPSDCFGDPSHLNENGAMRFTAEIKEKYAL